MKPEKKFESILQFVSNEPQPIAEIARKAGTTPKLCAGHLRALHGDGKIRLGAVQTGKRTLNTYRLAEPVKHAPQQREEYRGGPLPLRYESKETQRISFYRGVHTPAEGA